MPTKDASRARRFTECGTRHRQQHVLGPLCHRSDDECLCETSNICRCARRVYPSTSCIVRDAFLTVFTTTTDIIIMNSRCILIIFVMYYKLLT